MIAVIICLILVNLEVPPTTTMQDNREYFVHHANMLQLYYLISSIKIIGFVLPFVLIMFVKTSIIDAQIGFVS